MPKNSLKNILKKFGIGIYVLALLLLGGFLFFKDNFDFGRVFSGFGQKIGLGVQQSAGADSGTQLQIHQSADKLVIGYAFAPKSLNPLLFDSVTRSQLVDIYEGLVSTDRNLKIKPAIAITWGLLDDNTWEFKLRPGVKFHNGRILSTDDVVSSLERARSDNGSQLKDLLNTIDKIQVTAADKITIHTKQPDPLLLNKLAVTYIFPKNLESFEKPVGTGPYVFVSRNQDDLVLNSFNDYWGAKPFYQQVVLRTIQDRVDRTTALENGSIQLLTNVPPATACDPNGKYANADGCSQLQNKNIVVKSIPSLEVNFIAFNFSHSLLGNQGVRAALLKALDSQFFADLAFGYAKSSSQFISSGVFGFNPEIAKPAYDLNNAKVLITKLLAASFDPPIITFDYPEALDSLGQYVKDQFAQLGIIVNLDPLSDQLLQDKITTGKSDMYFFGWKSELGDSFDFLSAVGHSRDDVKGFGQFNFSNYKNEQVDQLIEKSQHNLDMESRLQDLQAAMKILVDDDVMGMPLFESDVIYAFDKKITFEPRVDGYVHASEIN